MTTYYIFRHGNTKNTDNNNLVARLITRNGGGPVNLPILPKSRFPLKKIGEYLQDKEIDAFFTSPYLRCKQSSKIVGDVLGKNFKTDERIRELRSDAKGFVGFKRRIENFLKEIDSGDYSAVAICTHGAVMAAIKHYVTDGKFSYFQGLDFPSPGKLIVIRDKKVEILNFNK